MDCLPAVFEHICSLNLSVILVEWLFELMNCGQSVDAASLSRLYLISLRRCMLCRSIKLELAVLCLGLPAIPQYQKMEVDLVPPEFVGITANGETRLASIEHPVSVPETS